MRNALWPWPWRGIAAAAGEVGFLASFGAGSARTDFDSRERPPATPRPGFVRLTAPETDEEGKGRHALEVEQRLESDAADLADVAGPGDADDQRGEDQRGDDRLDQIEKEDRQRP